MSLRDVHHHSVPLKTFSHEWSGLHPFRFLFWVLGWTLLPRFFQLRCLFSEVALGESGKIDLFENSKIMLGCNRNWVRTQRSDCLANSLLVHLADLFSCTSSFKAMKADLANTHRDRKDVKVWAKMLQYKRRYSNSMANIWQTVWQTVWQTHSIHCQAVLFEEQFENLLPSAHKTVFPDSPNTSDQTSRRSWKE